MLCLFTKLTVHTFDEEQQEMFILRVLHTYQVGVVQESIEQLMSRGLRSGDQTLASTLFPTVAVGRWRGPLQTTIVAFMTYAGALGTTAEGIHQSTRSTFQDILRMKTNETGSAWWQRRGRFGRKQDKSVANLSDVVWSGPSEATRVVVAECEQW